MPNNAMEKESLLKKQEIDKKITSGDNKIRRRKKSIVEIRSETYESEERVKKYGPNLFTGEGMDSKLFLEKLNSEEQNQRPKWQKPWERTSSTKGLDSKTFVVEIQTKSKERIEQIRNFAKTNQNTVIDIFGGDTKALNEYLETREKNIIKDVETVIEASNQEERRRAAEIIAVEADRLQRLEWRLNHAESLEDQSKETKENIQKAYDRLKKVSTVDRQVDYRSLIVITDAVNESVRRTKPHLESEKEDYKKLYESWHQDSRILANMILKTDSSFKTYNEAAIKNKTIKLIEKSKLLLQSDIGNRFANEPIGKNGPNLLTGMGMDSQQFLDQLKKREERSHLRKAWDHIPAIGGDTSRETLIKGIAAKIKDRLEKLHTKAKQNPEKIREIFNVPLSIFEEQLKTRESDCVWLLKAEKSAPDTKERQRACEMLAVVSDEIQRWEWITDNADNLQYKGITDEYTLNIAFDNIQEDRSDYRAFVTITDGIRDRSHKLGKNINSIEYSDQKLSTEKLSSDLRKAWEDSANWLVNTFAFKNQTYTEDAMQAKFQQFVDLSRAVLNLDKQVEAYIQERKLIDTGESSSPSTHNPFSQEETRNDLLD